MIPQEKVVDLLASGLSTSAIAEALGCSQSYISQLQSQDSIAEAVQAKKVAKTAKAIETETKLTDIKQVLVNRLSELAPYMTKPMEVVRVLEVVDNMERKSAMRPAQSTGNQIVQLVLPKQSHVRFTLSAQNEVIEVEGRPMASLPAPQIWAQLQEKSPTQVAQRFQRPQEKISVEDM